jgi:hypothetical protein
MEAGCPDEERAAIRKAVRKKGIGKKIARLAGLRIKN